MKHPASLLDIEEKCHRLSQSYEIDEEKFYYIVEIWAEKDVSTEEKILNSFHGLLDLIDKEIKQMEDSVQLETTCRLGCAFCCYFPIIINEMEAKIIKRVIAAFPDERKESIQLHLDSYYRTFEEKIKELAHLYVKGAKDKLSYRQLMLPCPLLNRETNQCMAYEVRPLPCRTYVNYTNPKVCEENLLPKETVSFEFLYEQYMGALNELLQYLYETEDTAYIKYPDDVYKEDFLVSWLKEHSFFYE